MMSIEATRKRPDFTASVVDASSATQIAPTSVANRSPCGVVGHRSGALDKLASGIGSAPYGWATVMPPQLVTPNPASMSRTASAGPTIDAAIKRTGGAIPDRFGDSALEWGWLG